ncbi:MAG TPA: histidinol-phosphate transaminase [Dehalococcoidia bacterium]|nr:histidinol-phosphate transaminase [Dehalococcoidia bacterium]
MTPKRIEDIIRPDIWDIKQYIPIEPPEVLGRTRGISPERIIKLDGNENPYGCSPRVGEALARHRGYHFYPDPGQQELRKALQNYVGLDASYIIAGSGSDELIDLLLRAVIGPGDKVIDCPPTFGMYRFSTLVCGGRVVDVPRDDEYHILPDRVLEAVDDGTKMIFLASPNNPTGAPLPLEIVPQLLKTGILVVLDEAYYEFSGKTMAHEVPRHENLIVLRTFSKWAGLAGLRVGYGIMQEAISRHLWKIKPPYNVNVSAQVAVQETLADVPYLMANIEKVIAERERMSQALGDLGFLKPYPSEANFVFCQVLRGRGVEIRDALRERGIFVRYFDTPLTHDALRISVGRPEDTDVLLEALREIGKGLS